MDNPAGSAPRVGANSGQGDSVRRLPDGSACGRWGTCRPANANHPWPRNRRPDRCDRNRRGRADDGRTRRYPMARPHLRPLSLLPHTPGKPVRPSDLHRIHARWWFCHRDNRRCALRLPAGRSRRRRVSCAIALRWAYRLAVSGHRRRWTETRPLWLRRRSPYRRASRDLAGAIRIRLHPTWGRRHPSLRPDVRGHLGRRLRRAAA